MSGATCQIPCSGCAARHTPGRASGFGRFRSGRRFGNDGPYVLRRVDKVGIARRCEGKARPRRRGQAWSVCTPCAQVIEDDARQLEIAPALLRRCLVEASEGLFVRLRQGRRMFFAQHGGDSVSRCFSVAGRSRRSIGRQANLDGVLVVRRMVVKTSRGPFGLRLQFHGPICSVRWSLARSQVTLTLGAPPPLTFITKRSFAAAGEEFILVPGTRRANNRCSFTTAASVSRRRYSSLASRPTTFGSDCALEHLFVIQRVGPRVNNPRDDDPECVTSVVAA